MPTLPSSRMNLLLVTFDLNQPRPGDLRYRSVDRLLSRIGATIRPFKQTRLVVTSDTPSSVRAAIRSLIGLRGNVGVLRLSSRSTVDIADPVVRSAVRKGLARYGSP